MGYEQQQVASKFGFALPARNYAGALAAIQALHARLPRPVWLDPGWEKIPNLIDMLAAWGWRAIEHADGTGIYRIEWEWEKAGDEDALFDAIAPFVTAGSYIHMCGEDDVEWKWKFDGKTCKKANKLPTKFEGE